MEQYFRITNYYEHPTQEMYIVVHYMKLEQADLFTEYLTKEQIDFEAYVDEEGGRPIYLFGIHKKHMKKIVELNFLTIGKTRQPFVPNAYFRWFLILLFFFLIFLSIMGYLYRKG